MSDRKHDWVYNYQEYEICCANCGQGLDIGYTKELEQKAYGF